MTDPSAEQIAQWKAEYGSVYIAGNYYFRAITLKEYQSIQSDVKLSSVEKEEGFIRVALLYPLDQDFDGLPAGIFSQLSEEILECSGFQNPTEAKLRLERQREEDQGSIFTLMKALILATMPTYTEEDLENLTFNQLVKKVSLAEQIIEVHQGIMSGAPVTLAIIDPNEEVETDEVQRQKHAAQKKMGEAGFDDPIAKRLHEGLG